MNLKHFLLLAPEPGDTGGSADDRGDSLTPDMNPEDPDGKPAEAAAEAAAEALKKELEPEDGDEDAEDKPKSKKDSRIPESRHKAILEKEREKRADLERQLAQYQSGGQIADVNAQITAAENDIAELDKEYNALLTDGEVDKAAALMQRIRATERQMSEAKSDMKIHAAEIRATERARYSTALERVEMAFPTLNPDHDDYDEEAMSEVADLKSAYEMKGLTPTAALQKAVKMIVEPRTTRQEMATTTKPNVTEKDIAAERKTEAVKKTAEAVSKTPAALTKVGKDGDKMGGGRFDADQVMSMSQKEFATLNDADLARMRGDVM